MTTLTLAGGREGKMNAHMEGMEMEQHKVFRTGQAALVFVGEKIAGDSSKTHNSTRWNILNIYRTAKGKLVMELIHRTYWQGEHDEFIGQVFANEQELISAVEDLELGELASDVLDKCGFVETVG